eukprot:gene11513-4677_t
MNFGIISAANIAIKVTNAINSTKTSKVVAISSRNLEKAKKFAEENNIEKYFGSYDELLNLKEIDAIYIPLPTSLCAEWCIKAAKAKKHVLCDKPLSNVKDVKEILKTCKENGVQFMDNTMFLHHDRTKILKSKEVQEKIGDIKHIQCSLSFLLDDDSNIRLKKELEPQGALGDLGWYCVKFILHFYNWELPEQLFATGNYKNNDKNNVLTGLNAILWFKNGRKAQFDISFEMSRRQIALVTGTKSSFRLDNFVTAGDGKMSYEIASGRNFIKHEVDECVQEKNLIETFSNKISEEWGEQSLKTQIVIDSLEESATKESIISIQ